MDKRRDGHLKITVCSLTRERPKMLANLINSWGRLVLPENCSVSFLVVENDQSPKSEKIVLATNPLPNGVPVEYVLETKIGIPVARNRAAREAVSSGSDLLALVDDDEIVDQNWLVEIVATYRNGTGSVIGGPRYFSAPSDDLTRRQAEVLQCLIDDGEDYIKQSKAHVKNGTMRDRKVYTHNWLSETSLFSEEGVWFDEKLGNASGEDVQYCRDILAIGYETDWSPNAFVTETVPKERLTYTYQYKRAKNFFTPWLYARLQTKKWNTARLLLRLMKNSVKLIVLVIVFPIAGGRWRFNTAQTAGWVAGCISTFFFQQERLYNNVTGD